MTDPQAIDAGSILDAARNIAPQIDALRSEIELERRLPPSLVEAMRSAHLFELWVPRKFGGLELHPVDFVRVIEVLSRADGSVGWCATIANVYGLVAGSLPEAAAGEIFGNHEIVAGTINPTGTAIAVDDGYRVTGRWAYGSGIDHSSWVLANCIIFDGTTPRRTSSGGPDMRFMFFPRNNVDIIDTWHVGGMRGTGSHDFRVDDLFVPTDRSIPAFISLGTQPGTLFRTPLISLFVVALAAVTLGIARAALDALYELAGAKTPMGSTVLLRDKPAAQSSAAARRVTSAGCPRISLRRYRRAMERGRRRQTTIASKTGVDPARLHTCRRGVRVRRRPCLSDGRGQCSLRQQPFRALLS